VALKKPSEYFKKEKPSVDNSVQELAKTPELNTFSDAFESFKKNLSKIEVLSEFSDTLDNYRVNIEKVNYLSEKVEDIQTEVQSLLKKEDLDRAMMSQLLVVEQSIRDVQSKVKGINEKNLTEIRLDVSGLTESVNEFLEVEVPKYKKLVVDSELRTNNRYEELEENVNKTLEGIGEYVDNKYLELTESLQGINEQSLAGIVEDFNSLDKIVFGLKEQEIPKYKGFIVETERKTESKLNEFNNILNQTVDNLLKKITLVEGDKSNLIKVVNDKIQEVLSLRDLVLDDLEQSESSRNDLIKKISDLEVEVIRNESHLKVQNKNLEKIQEDVRSAIQKLNIEQLEEKNYDLGKKVKYLEEVFEKFSEKEILTENIIIEPSSTDNKDPLTPLDQNFVTLDQLQQHYRLFINRIQQQLATIGGGGETRFEFLDDIDRDSVKQDGYVIQYNASVGKFIGTSYVPGGGGNVAIAITSTAPSSPIEGNLWYDIEIGRAFLYYTDEDGSQWVDIAPSGTSSVSGAGSSIQVYDGYPNFVGVVTAIDFGSNLSVSPVSSGIVTISSSGGGGDYANIAGIATYATSSGISTYSTAAGIATYATSSGISTYSTAAGIATYATSSGISTYSTAAGIATYAVTAGVSTSVIGGISSVTQLNVTGISALGAVTVTQLSSTGVITATSFSGSGVNLTGIVTSITAGTGITINQSTGNVTINSTQEISSVMMSMIF
jgi:hypothetical protein